MRGISPLTVLSVVASLADRAGRGGEVRTTVAKAIDLVQDRVCLVDGTITPCWSYAGNDELWSRQHGTTGFNAQLVCLLDGAAIYISDPLPGCTRDAKGISPPRPSPRLLRTPVAGSWIKAQRHQRWRSDLLCAVTERETLRTRAVRGDPCPINVSQMAGRSRTSTGQNATMLLLRGGVAVDRWERLRGGALGFGPYQVRNAYASSSTTTSRAMRATCSGSARSPRGTPGFIRNAESLRGEHAARADGAYQLYRRRERHPRTDRPTGSAMRTPTRHASGSSASGTRSGPRHPDQRAACGQPGRSVVAVP